jgi:hypothetical protein
MITLDSIQLPDDLEWVDEFSWSYVKNTYKTTIGGTIIVEERQLINGRPITLSGTDRYGVATRSVVESLYAKANTIGDVMILTLHDNRAFSVIFDRAQQPLTAIPIDVAPAPIAGTLYQITLRLIEV